VAIIEDVDCLLCGTEIEELWGQVSTLALIDGKWVTQHAHRECLLREVMGGIGHLEDHDFWCLGVGDPDGGRTYRQSALEVAEWARQRDVP